MHKDTATIISTSNESPLRSELFSSEQLKRYGKTLAASHRLGKRGRPDWLLERLDENERVLVDACGLLTEAVKESLRVTPAGEWLLDNFYLIEEQIRTARRHLPRGYSRELPRLASGPSAGLPRVYDIALEAISHGDGRVDLDRLIGFVASYQTVGELTLGELWAVPIMLRLALLENIRRVAARNAADRLNRNLAVQWVDRMVEVVATDPKSLILVIADMARSNPPMGSAFVAEFARRLQGQSPGLTLSLTWVEQRLSESGMTIEQMVRLENQQQAADHVSLSNSIRSLRFLGATDWREFVEAISLVEQRLRRDPPGIYALTDFTTRDRCRHVVERISKRSSLSEVEVAAAAVELATEAADELGREDRRANVNYFLLDRGLPELERRAKMRRSLPVILSRCAARHPLAAYLGAAAAVTAAVAWGFVSTAVFCGTAGWLLLLVSILSVLAAGQLAISMVNWVVTVVVPSRPLPRMDFSKGIPPEARTLVAVPTMLTSPNGVDDLLEALEVRFLANRDAYLHFALLTDFKDASSESLPGDEALVERARKGIEGLNEKYGGGRGDIFFLFHRPRRWNPHERVWMGYERKRGKLADLNALLRGDAGDRFSVVEGETEVLSNVKYVITLDTDTQLPRDAARQFVGAMFHPLNRPRFDSGGRRVLEGYSILQPRMAVSLPVSGPSPYSKLFGSDSGVDPYTLVVSDLYQDLFGEGSFVGKGIYDVDSFEGALAGRFPENRILSHDLIEGCYARSGFFSDAVLFEAYPQSYRADVDRRRRWIRGDWQIAAWLFPWVPAEGGGYARNSLSMLCRWKIFDNLRRSVTPAALLLLMLLGWCALSPAWFWTASVFGIFMLPQLGRSVNELLSKPEDASFLQNAASVMRSFSAGITQSLFSIACLPYEAMFSLDAVLRTLGRLFFTHRSLLEWRASTDPVFKKSETPASALKSMSVSPVLAASAGVATALLAPASLAVAGPLILVWLVSPGIAWWMSRPALRRAPQLGPAHRAFLRKVSRKTWAFFETFVGPEDSWLPPDNYEEHRDEPIGHRTSPTNIGLSLLANLSAFDFGYIPAGVLIERTSNTFDTMDQLERYRGHFYNWYDTQTLAPLQPVYISTVDSGNLAGHLLTLRQGLIELSERRILEPRWREGIEDAIWSLGDQLDADWKRRFDRVLVELGTRPESSPEGLSASWRCLSRVDGMIDELTRLLVSDPNASELAKWWAQRLAAQCRAITEDLASHAPWLSGSNEASSLPFSDAIPTLRDLARATDDEGLPAEISASVQEGRRRAIERIAAMDRLALRAEEFARMDHDFLLDKTRRLMAIGYNVNERRRDPSSYDLLASEARLACFVAIAQGDLPQESWFALGRLLTRAAGQPVLYSWSGSMFEYLMPMLVMPSYEGTLLDQTCGAAVEAQISYGKKRGVPWGVSESCYNALDVNFNYQYRAFGVPGLGLKRGLAEDLVIAPYASMLALMVAPRDACRNLQRLSSEGVQGRYGFYEAVDYTNSRLPRGHQQAVIRSFMAHHQGMGFLSLAWVLLDRPMQRRFSADPLFQATMLLLQERIPRATAFHSQSAEFSDVRPASEEPAAPMRVFKSYDTPAPEVQLLSNGRYHVMVTNAGGGYSRWNDLAVTRWREDATCDNAGMFCYLRDVESGEFWSAAYQPTQKKPVSYEALFSEARAEFRTNRDDYDVHTEIAVSPEDDVELRRVRITNRSRLQRTIDVTSYAEVVLSSPAADELHPAFNKLFVQTEIVPKRRAIFCTRRPRSAGELVPWMFHQVYVHGGRAGEPSFESDRTSFLGRGNTVENPRAVAEGSPLAGTQGSALDPVVAVRYRITLEPHAAATVNIVTGVGESREAVDELAEKYHDRRLAARAFDLAWVHSQVSLRQLNATEADAQLYGRLAGSILYAHSALRAPASDIIRNRRGQSGLWGYAISGDLPIVLVQISDLANIELVRQMVQAHAYWRMRGLVVDLVIWNNDQSGYRQSLQEQVMSLIAGSVEASLVDRPGGIFVRSIDQIPTEDRILFQTIARAIISDSRGTLEQQLGRRHPKEPSISRIAGHGRAPRNETALQARPERDLAFSNGLGGFTRDGREYVIITGRGEVTPSPWVNVIANPRFGTVVSESGLSYTWSENAHEFRLTPWANDPVCDSAGEAFYLRDEESGHYWSPTPLPAPGKGHRVSRHGFGYSVFESFEDGIRSELWIYVATDAPAKLAVLKVRNESGRYRRLSATGYVEWVLGCLRSRSAMHVVTDIDPASGAVFARNAYNAEFAERVAFFDAGDEVRTVTGNRLEFIGRNRSIRNPAGMERVRLSNRVGAAFDPCAAIQVSFDLVDGQERETVFTLGAGANDEEARALVYRFRGEGARTALEGVWEKWNRTLGAVYVETPDAATNALANGWLLYQTISCRMWARNGYYQPGGAFGFRDQLQDAMSLVHAEPGLLREHILLAASRQFREGDAQHWWHPPSGRGVRTRCSDDFLWLPAAVCRYVLSTGDTGVLDEPVPFLEGRLLNSDEESYYDLPARSGEPASLYEHCVRAILRGLTSGPHGLPLIGSGDWNDGMNLVGEEGRGESVWLGFFLYHVLMTFESVAKEKGDAAFAARCLDEAKRVKANIEHHGWDGEWYRRAFFDDGAPLGSALNTECRIDAIAQSWSVISGAGDPERARLAMEALDRHLVDREHSLIKLLAPPFDTSELNPGYIKGYVPGVRENGGQYTHGAVWAAMAFAALGDSDRAWELLGIINPVNHASTPEASAVYRVEPYVVAADVYASKQHTGSGGWTWYTGSAAWMYRLIVESLLGLNLKPGRLEFSPRLPRGWDSVKISYRYRETIYAIEIRRSADGGKGVSVSLDGERQEGPFVSLDDDRRQHEVEVVI